MLSKAPLKTLTGRYPRCLTGELLEWPKIAKGEVGFLCNNSYPSSVGDFGGR